MQYFEINNFLDKKTCENLIIDYKQYSKNKKNVRIHDSRDFLSSSDENFKMLCESSLNWNNLYKKINSTDFLNLCLKKLNLEKDRDKFYITSFFNSRKKDQTYLKYKSMGKTEIKKINDKALLKYTLYRLYRSLLRKIKFSRIFNFKKKPLEILFDVSKAGNGYKREIHRDSDNRFIVFLIYINNLDQNSNSSGGNFDIYHNEQNYNEFKKNLKKIKSIKPEAGKLIAFLNEDQSFHAVDEMKNFEEYRYFLYGSFTFLNNENPYIKFKTKSKTEFHLYE